MREGVGRHADSGNRGNLVPRFQWISVGSGIEHAEGGGNSQERHSWISALGECSPCAKKRSRGTAQKIIIHATTAAGEFKVTVIAGPLQGSNAIYDGSTSADM